MRPPRLQQFADLIPILDAAVANGGGTATLATHGDAVHWRQRVYKYRKRLQQAYGSSPYDALVMPRIPDDSNEVVMEVRTASAVFTPFGDDPLDAAALSVARKVL